MFFIFGSGKGLKKEKKSDFKSALFRLKHLPVVQDLPEAMNNSKGNMEHSRERVAPSPIPLCSSY